jgi:hypothetical protein
VDCTREYNGPTSADWKPFKMNFKLCTEYAGQRELLPEVYTITSTDFDERVGSTGKQFTAVISNSKLRDNAYLRIAYNIPSVVNGVTYQAYTVYEAYRYLISVVTPDPSAATLAKIASMGFNTTGIKTFSTYYLVENDIRLNKNGLSQTNYTVNNDYSHNINIALDWALVDKWYSTVFDAIRIWNSNNSDIKLNLVIANNPNYAAPPRIDISIK